MVHHALLCSAEHSTGAAGNTYGKQYRVKLNNGPIIVYALLYAPIKLAADHDSRFISVYHGIEVYVTNPAVSPIRTSAPISHKCKFIACADDGNNQEQSSYEGAARASCFVPWMDAQHYLASFRIDFTFSSHDSLCCPAFILYAFGFFGIDNVHVIGA